jgi:flagellin-like hook-associated protein FlgL
MGLRIESNGSTYGSRRLVDRIARPQTTDNRPASNLNRQESGLDQIRGGSASSTARPVLNAPTEQILGYRARQAVAAYARLSGGVNAPTVSPLPTDQPQASRNERPGPASIARAIRAYREQSTSTTDDLPPEGANRANTQLDAAQARLEASLQNLESYTRNISAAEGRIRDADYSEESSRLARFQLLQRSGVAALGEANKKSQEALSLLG